MGTTLDLASAILPERPWVHRCGLLDWTQKVPATEAQNLCSSAPPSHAKGDERESIQGQAHRWGGRCGKRPSDYKAHPRTPTLLFCMKNAVVYDKLFVLESKYLESS